MSQTKIRREQVEPVTANVSLTTANYTASENYNYNLTIAGLTGNRDFILPAPSAANNDITVTILDGDDTYEVTIKGDSGVSINGGSAATAFVIVNSKAYSITFRSTSTTNWQVVSSSPAANYNVYKDFITGFKMQYDSTNSIFVGQGACYIPSLDDIRENKEDLSVTASLSSSTWYYVYVYPNGGNLSAEFSTTAPLIYHGLAGYKIGDASRRFIGAVRTDGSGNLFKFVHNANMNYMGYLEKTETSPFRVLSGGTATTETTVDASGIVPILSQIIHVKLTNTDASRILALGNSIDNVDMSSSGNGIFHVSPSTSLTANLITDTSQDFSYRFDNTTTGGGAYIDVLGYYYER